MTDYGMAVILNAAIRLKKTKEGVKEFKKAVNSVVMPIVKKSVMQTEVIAAYTALYPRACACTNPECDGYYIPGNICGKCGHDSEKGYGK